MKVFLGGTCGANHWREDIVIPGLLERGVSLEQIINPVVEHWTPDMQAQEDAAKRDEQNILLFVIASPDPATADVSQVSGYSLVEVTRAVFKSPERTMVLVDTSGLAKRAAKSIDKAAQDWREDSPWMPIYREYGPLLDELAARLRVSWLGGVWHSWDSNE